MRRLRLSKRGRAICRRPGKAQGSLEMVIALITILTILLCALNLFIWLNQRFAWRQRDYEAGRVSAGSYVRPSGYAGDLQEALGGLNSLEALKGLSRGERGDIATELETINKDIKNTNARHDLHDLVKDLATELRNHSHGGLGGGQPFDPNHAKELIDQINNLISQRFSKPPPGAVDESGYPKLDIFNLKEWRTWWEWRGGGVKR